MPERSNWKLVVVDRNGTLNVWREDWVKAPEEFEPLPGALEAVARLNQAGWHVVVASNLSGLGRGLFDMVALNGIHHKLNACLAAVGGRIDAIFYCPHAPEDNCRCRKPLTGLYEDIAERVGVELADMHVVGDSLVDIEGAKAAGCHAHLLLSGRYSGLSDAEREPILAQVGDARVHADLAAFTDQLLAAERRKAQEARQDAKRPTAAAPTPDRAPGAAPT
jgi:D-glycero-D-manno-heptose 1,7-bisphosphate phosphatase